MHVRNLKAGINISGYAALWFLSGQIFASTQLSVAQPSRDPAELVRTVVQNEVKASTNSAEPLFFSGTKTTPRGSTTKLYVETSEATAGMVIAYNGTPLTPEQRRGEQARLERFVKDPEELRKKKAQEREDAARTMRIVRALPDAFLYEYDGQEMGTEGVGKPGEPLVRLKFRPNPNYDPPTRVEEVLRGMQGYVLVDAAHERMASIDGTLFRDVGFGWGILGHLDKGGRFVVHQQAVDGKLWAISSMSLKFTGRILLVRSLAIDSTEVFSGYKRVASNLTFAQGLELLAKEEAGAGAAVQADRARR